MLLVTSAASAQFGLKKREANKPRKNPKTSLFGSKKKKDTPAKKTRPGSSAPSPQWQLGMKGGINLTDVSSTAGYSVFDNLAGPAENIAKTYDDPYSNLGVQFGLSGAFNINDRVSLLVEPVFSSVKFGYTNHYEWLEVENPGSNILFDYDFDHTVNYIETPLLVRYHLLDGPLKPFIQGGGYYGFLIEASKEIGANIEDNSSGGESILTTTSQEVGIDEQFIKSSVGLVGGIGVSYDVGNSPLRNDGSTDLGVVRFSLSINYKYGLNNITDVQNRFLDSSLISGAYDSLDDLELRNIEISLSTVFTLKYKSQR